MSSLKLWLCHPEMKPKDHFNEVLPSENNPSASSQDDIAKMKVPMAYI